MIRLVDFVEALDPYTFDMSEKLLDKLSDFFSAIAGKATEPNGRLIFEIETKDYLYYDLILKVFEKRCMDFKTEQELEFKSEIQRMDKDNISLLIWFGELDRYLSERN